MGNTHWGGGICVTYSPTVQEGYERGEVNMDDLVEWGARTSIKWQNRYIEIQEDIYKYYAIYKEILTGLREGWSWRSYCREVDIDPKSFRRWFKKAKLPLLGGAIDVEFIGGEAQASPVKEITELETPEEVKEDVVAVQAAIEEGQIGPKELTELAGEVANAVRDGKIPPGIAQMFNMME